MGLFCEPCGGILESRRRYKKQPGCRNDLKPSRKRPGGVGDASCGSLETPWRYPGGLWGRPGGVFLFIGDVFLFTIDGARIASPQGSHFFMISEATTRTYQTRIRIQKEAKVCILHCRKSCNTVKINGFCCFSCFVS